MKKSLVASIGLALAVVPVSASALTQYPKYVDDGFNRYGDGSTMSLAGYEIWTGQGPSAVAETKFATMDTDQDGRLSKDEYMAGFPA